MINKQDVIRTVSIIKELALGKTLKMGNFTLAMGEDMSVGFLYEIDGENRVVSSMTLEELNAVLNKHEIGVVIPTYRELLGL